MADNISKKQTKAKVNFDFSSFGGGKKPGKRKQKKAVNSVKSIGIKGILIVLLSLIIGIGVGVGALFIIAKNDCFEIINEDVNNPVIQLYVDQLYEDEGCKVIAFGKDISNQVVVETNLLKDEATGAYYAVECGSYYIKYTTNDIKYGKLFIVEKYKLFSVIEKDAESSGEGE